MIYYTKYGEQKFDILNKYKIYLTKEQIEEVVLFPKKVTIKNNYFFVKKENIEVIYKKEKGIIKIITFYPVSNK